MTERDTLATLSEASPHPRVDAAPAAVHVGPCTIGGGAPPVLIAGPCAVEDEAQIETAARLVAAAGGKILRGGAFKPRTSPYSFQGLGAEGVRLIRAAADRHGLAVVTEALDERSLADVGPETDMIQVGSRSMHSYGLLKAVGAYRKPVLLKRGMSATIPEWLLAAEYLFEAGASGVVLCERGIRTFDETTRNTLDLGAVAYLLEHHALAVVVDPSHGCGRSELVPRLSRAALAVGAHGLMVEVHPDPPRALSDAEQALTPATFESLARELFGGGER